MISLRYLLCKEKQSDINSEKKRHKINQNNKKKHAKKLSWNRREMFENPIFPPSFTPRY